MEQYRWSKRANIGTRMLEFHGYLGVLNLSEAWCEHAGMRVNLFTQSCAESTSAIWPVPVSLTIRPSCGLPGDYQYSTDMSELMGMLRKKTDLRADTLKRFETELRSFSKAKLCGVELSERVLTEIGYFVD